MSLPDAVLERITRLLSTSAGTPISIVQSESAASGWSTQFGTSPWPHVTRYTIQADTGLVPSSVVVKVRRPAVHRRSEPELFHNEQAALEFLTVSGSAVAPRLLTADNEAGILVMEDLGTGPALEDLLAGRDAFRASQGLVAFSAALGQMHAATAGHATEYYQLRRRHGPVDPAFDRSSIFGIGIESAFRRLREITASRSYLPALHDVGPAVDEILRVLSEPGPISPSPMEIPALPTAACQATACGSSTLSTPAFAMRCSTLPLCASPSRLARAGPVCLKKWAKEPKRPTGRRWLAPAPPSSIRRGTRTGSLRRVRPGRWCAWCACPSWKRPMHPSRWVSHAGGNSSIPSPPR